MGGPLLTVGAGETETIAAGETLETATVNNAGTVSNAGTLQAGGLELDATAADIDALTVTLTRTRDLSATAADIDSATATLIEGFTLEATASDIDAGSASLTRTRDLSATAADVDALTLELVRVRELSITSVDVDAVGGIALERTRDLVASASDPDDGAIDFLRERTLAVDPITDVDAATAKLIFRVQAPNATNAVELIVALLSGARDSYWSATTPDVRHYWDDAASERGPGADQPPVLYAWSPAGQTHERFSMDGNRTDDTGTVEVQVWSLDEPTARVTADDVREILQLYHDDNTRLTGFHSVEPTVTNDFREQKPARTTDHYVFSVEVDAHVLADAGK